MIIVGARAHTSALHRNATQKRDFRRAGPTTSLSPTKGIPVNLPRGWKSSQPSQGQKEYFGGSHYDVVVVVVVRWSRNQLKKDSLGSRCFLQSFDKLSRLPSSFRTVQANHGEASRLERRFDRFFSRETGIDRAAAEEEQVFNSAVFDLSLGSFLDRILRASLPFRV